jgi:hypothetical protein
MSVDKMTDTLLCVKQISVGQMVFNRKMWNQAKHPNLLLVASACGELSSRNFF